MSSIRDALSRGLVTGSALDSAVFRLLLARVKLGMFSDPAVRPWFRTDSAALCSAANDSLAASVAAGGMVLLRNENRLLPLPRSMVKLGIAGAIASDTLVLLGNYNGTPVRPVPLLEGLRAAAGPGTQVIFTPGYLLPWDTAWNAEHSAELTGRALRDLDGIDTVVVVAGISAALEGEDGDTRNKVGGFFHGDRTTLGLPPDQSRLIRDLRSAGKTIVLAVTSGSAVTLADESPMAGAVVQCWYPGQRGGDALGSVLFGRVDPSGRLPVTVYRSVDDLPPMEEYSMENRTYRYFRGEPLYPFGYGLSYTTFTFDSLAVATPSASAADTIRLSVRVTNAGVRDGMEVVQAYVGKPGDAGDDGAVKSLCAFAKVFARAGETIVVRLDIAPEQLRAYDPGTGRLGVAAGRYSITVGRNSRDRLLDGEFFLH
jgi:beta-glucosidase